MNETLKTISEAVEKALKGAGDKVKQGYIDAKVTEELGRRQSIFTATAGKLTQLEQVGKRIQPVVTGYEPGANGRPDMSKPIKNWTPELVKAERELNEAVKNLTEKLEKAMSDNATNEDWTKLKEATDKAQVPNPKGGNAAPAEENKAS